MNQVLPISPSPGRLPDPFEVALADLPLALGTLLRSTINAIDPAPIEAAIERAEVFGTTVAAELRIGNTPATNEGMRHVLDQLVSAWPNASRGDIAGYAAQLTAEILASRPSRYALNNTLKHLRRTSRFLPSIAEVLDTIAAAEARLANAITSHQRFPDAIEKARHALDAARAAQVRDQEFDRRQAERRGGPAHEVDRILSGQGDE